jgi:methylenetetrahydrofolate dehydrogenase (NADP+)/methenyltetrahydrofolate cyclohydrolase
VSAVLDGKAVAASIRSEVAAGCAALAMQRGIVPGLTVVQVGDNPASDVYVRNKEKAAREVGMHGAVVHLPESSSEDAILATVRGLNLASGVHGILVQLPLPSGVRVARVLEAVDPVKDVDGFHPVNAGKLLTGARGFVPCTPAGIVELLKRSGIPFARKRAVVIGRSNIVGKPMAVLLLREDCTVTVCHSKTRELAEIASQADILVAAIGKPGAIGGDAIKPGAVVVDVGIHTVSDEATCRRLFGDDEARLRQVREKGSTLVGDVHPVEAAAKAGWLTPVPGGVGPLTIAMLLRNTLDAARGAAERG